MRVHSASKAALLGAVLLIGVASRPAAAAPVLGGQLTYTGGTVTITTLPVTSGFTSVLGLYDASLTNLVELVNDEPPGVVAVVNPSAYGIAVGAELIFGIRIVNNGNRFYMGPAARNPDGIMHATLDGPGVVTAYGTGYVVGFEDILGGGDRDFDDNKFLFQGGITAPEPSLLALMAVGAGIGLARRRRA